MVTAVETRVRVETKPITLQELGEMIGIPIVVRPWWGSVRHRSVRHFLEVKLQGDDIQVVDNQRKAKVQLTWECPAEGRNRKRRPEVQNGMIVLWKGQCHLKVGSAGGRYPPHSHAQRIQVKSVAHQAMLISLRLSGVESRFLLGVDGGTPYVIQVTRRPQTVEEAFQWLMPKMVKEAIAQGLDVKRQGDWYFIPRTREPAIYQNGTTYAAMRYRMNTLYRGAFLVYNYRETRHWGAQVVFQSVLGLPSVAPLVKGKVSAPDHEPLYLDDWHIGVRNRSHPWRNVAERRARFDD